MSSKEILDNSECNGLVMLPCPFCGSESQGVRARAIKNGIENWVACYWCGSRGQPRNNPASAIEAWNRRQGDKCHNGCAVDRELQRWADETTSDY